MWQRLSCTTHELLFMAIRLLVTLSVSKACLFFFIYNTLVIPKPFREWRVPIANFNLGVNNSSIGSTDDAFPLITVFSAVFKTWLRRLQGNLFFLKLDYGRCITHSCFALVFRRRIVVICVIIIAVEILRAHSNDFHGSLL